MIRQTANKIAVKLEQDYVYATKLYDAKGKEVSAEQIQLIQKMQMDTTAD